MTGHVRIIGYPKPLSADGRLELAIPPGSTLAELIEQIALPADPAQIIATLNGRAVALDAWPRTTPKSDDLIVARIRPAGDAGSGKNLFSSILSIAAIAGAWYAGPIVTAFLNLGGVAAAGRVSALMAMGAAALVPTPNPAKSGRYSGLANRELVVTQENEKLQPYATIPAAVGRTLFNPGWAAPPFTEFAGSKVYVRAIWLIATGPLEIHEETIELAGKPLTNLVDDPETDIEIRPGYLDMAGYADDEPRRLYAQQVYEEAADPAVIGAAWSTVEMLTVEATDEIAFLIHFPNGLFALDDTVAAMSWGTCNFKAQVSTDGVSWDNIDPDNETFAVTHATRRAFTSNIRHRLTGVHSDTADQYFLRIQLLSTTAPTPSGLETWTVTGTPYLIGFQSINCADPIALDDPSRARPIPVATVSARIPISDNTPPDLTALTLEATAIVQVYNGATWAWASSENPAWNALNLECGYPAPNPRSLDLVDADTWLAFATYCTAQEFTVGGTLDNARTTREQIQSLLACCKATQAKADSKFSVVWDEPRTAPTQHFAPENVYNVRVTHEFPPIPHAVRALFVDPESAWTQRERIAYRNGYNESTATLFETLELPFVTNARQAYILADYRLRHLLLRPRVIEFDTDFELLPLRRGDRVDCAFDVVSWGQDTARVARVNTGAGGTVVSVELTKAVRMASPYEYAARFRLVGAADPGELSSLTKYVLRIAGEQRLLIFTTAIPAGSPAPAVDDLVQFGTRGLEAVDAIVTGIRPNDEHGGTVVLQDHAEALHDLATIPAWNPQISDLPPETVLRPAAVTIGTIQTDETVLELLPDGSYASAIVAEIRYSSSQHPAPAYLEIQYRLSTLPSVPWLAMPVTVGAPVSVAIHPVTDGLTYDLRIRPISADLYAAEWAYASNVLVIGKSTPPPNVGHLTLEADVLRWTYPDAPRDLAGFEIRHHAGDSPSWDNATPLNGELVTTTFYLLPLLPGGARTLYVKAVDTAGNYSDAAASLTVNFGDHDIENRENAIPADWSASSWLAVTIDGGTVDGSNHIVADALRDPGDPLFWPSDPGATFWEAPGADFWPSAGASDGYGRLTVTTDILLTGKTIDPDNGGLEIALFCILDADGTTIRLEYCQNIENPTDDDWLPWPGRIRPTVEDYHRFRVVIESGDTQGIIRGLWTYYTFPDVAETVVAHVISTASAPERLSLAKTYTTIQSVIPVLRSSGPVGARVADKSASLGPQIFLLDAAGNNTTGTIDVFVKGFRGMT